jgi:hypothetical protein
MVEIPSWYSTMTGMDYLIFQVNDGQAILESDTTNNTFVLPIQVPSPDVQLAVSDVTAPPSVFVGEPFQVSWTVTNIGADSTTASTWLDVVFLSDTPTLDESARWLGVVASPDGLLGAGASDTNEGYFQIDVTETPGAKYLIVQANYDGAQAVTDTSSTTLAVPLQVTSPDVALAVTDVAAPPSVAAGELFPVSWTVANIGSDSTTASTWLDVVYLSDTPTLDESARWLGVVASPDGLLPAGASYTNSGEYFLIDVAEAPGAKYLIVQANFDGAQAVTDTNAAILAVPILLNPGEILPIDPPEPPIEYPPLPVELNGPGDGQDPGGATVVFDTVVAGDLQPVALTVTPGELHPGTALTLNWRDLNSGFGFVPSEYDERIRIVNWSNKSVLLDTTIHVEDARGSILPATSILRELHFTLPATTQAVGNLEFSVNVNALHNIAEANPRGNAYANDTITLTLPSTAPFLTAQVQLNDGSAQRSMIKSITVTFSEQVTLAPDAVCLQRQDGTDFPGVDVSTSVASGKTTAILTFHGTDVVAGALPDGRYLLTLRADSVHGKYGQALAGDGKSAGTDLVLSFYCLFGDTNGDGRVDDTDQNHFVTALQQKRGESGYLWYLDADGDGIIDQTDDLRFMAYYGKHV